MNETVIITISLAVIALGITVQTALYVEQYIERARQAKANREFALEQQRLEAERQRIQQDGIAAMNRLSQTGEALVGETDKAEKS